MCIVDPAVLSGQLHREDNLYVSQRHDASCSQKIARFRGRPARSWRAGRSGRSWLALCGELSFRRSGAGRDALALPSFSMVASGRRSKSRSRSAHSIIRSWRNHQNRLKIYRKISVRLSRRRPRLVEAKINPDCHVSSIGSAFRGIGRSPIWTALVIAK